MNHDKVIAVNSESERRQHQRRREDQVRTLEQAAEMIARERRWQFYREAFRAYLQRGSYGTDWREAYAEEAFKMLDVIERMERERQESK